MTLSELVAEAIREVMTCQARNAEPYEFIAAFDELARLFGIDMEALLSAQEAELG